MAHHHLSRPSTASRWPGPNSSAGPCVFFMNPRQHKLQHPNRRFNFWNGCSTLAPTDG